MRWFQFANTYSEVVQERLFELGWKWREGATLRPISYSNTIITMHGGPDRRISYRNALNKVSTNVERHKVGIIDALYPGPCVLPKWVKDAAIANGDVKPIKGETDHSTWIDVRSYIYGGELLQAAGTISMIAEIDRASSPSAIEASELRIKEGAEKTAQYIKECNCPINHLGVLHTIECQPLPYSPWPIRQPEPTLSAKEINTAHMGKWDGPHGNYGLRLGQRDGWYNTGTVKWPNGSEIKLSTGKRIEIISQLCGIKPMCSEGIEDAQHPLLTHKQAVEILKQDFAQSCKNDVTKGMKK